MDTNIVKGTLKTKACNSLIIRDYQISNIIKDALINNGYDLIVRALTNDVNLFTGEEIEVFK